MLTKRSTNICKGAAILLMILHHLFFDTNDWAQFTVDPAPLSTDALVFIANIAKVCVATFIFLSSYGITAVFEKELSAAGEQPLSRCLGGFIGRRWWKLMIVFWFVFILTLLWQPLGNTVANAYGGSKLNMAAYLIIDFLGLATALGTPTLNGPWWYMSVAILIVIIVPILVLIGKKIGHLLTAVVSMGVVITIFNGCNIALVVYMFTILLGIVAYEKAWFKRIRQWKEGSTGAYIIKLLVFGAALICLSPLRVLFNPYGLVDGLWALVFITIIHLLVGRLPKAFPVLELLGRYSGIMFYIHCQIYFYTFMPFFYGFGNWILIWLAVTVVSLGAAVVIDLIINRTGYRRAMEKLGNKLIGKMLS